jgi:hypothetical protein
MPTGQFTALLRLLGGENPITSPFLSPLRPPSFAFPLMRVYSIQRALYENQSTFVGHVKLGNCGYIVTWPFDCPRSEAAKAR